MFIVAIQFYLTDAGEAAALNAENLGINLSLSHMAVGSAKYDPVVASPSMTALNTELARYPLNGGSVEPVSGTLRFVANIKSTITAECFELGLITDDGVLFAVASTISNDPLVDLVNNIVSIVTFGFKLTNIDLSNVEIVIDPNTPISVALMNQHIAHADPHPQYTLKADMLPYLQSLANLIWHVGSWHGTDNISYNPSTALEPIFGYETNWEIRPYAPYGVLDEAGQVLQQFGIAGTDDKKANTTRIWKRLPDDFHVVITADKAFAFEGDTITFTLQADNVPDGATVLYELIGTGVEGEDFVGGEATGIITFYSNLAQLVVTLASSYPDDNHERAESVQLNLIAADVDSATVVVPTVYAGFSQIECVANTGSTYFVVATHGIPIGTECTIQCGLGSITQTFTIDATGRYILEVPLTYTFSGGTTEAAFGCDLTIMGVIYRDIVTLYSSGSGRTIMKLDVPTKEITSVMGTVDGTYSIAEHNFTGMGYAGGMNVVGVTKTSRTTASGLSSAVVGANDGSNVTLNIDSAANSLFTSGDFGVYMIGTSHGILGNPEDPFITKGYARLLIYKS